MAAEGGEPLDPCAVLTSLYTRHGDADYVGEAVSQREHAVQCAKAALDAGSEDAVVVAALLHDVGHLLGLERCDSGYERMGVYGMMDHERVGAQYLRELGFGPVTCQLVQRHVDAKRYLVAIDAGYHARLSDASRQTLVYQGGPMTEAEVLTFEADPLKPTILAMRLWDEAGKDTTMAGRNRWEDFLPIMRRALATAHA